MTLSISIDPQDPHGSDSLSDEEDSGVHVGSHDYEVYDNEWAHLTYPDELKPSDSASRPRTSHRNRSHHGSRSASGRPPPANRRMVSDREPRESYGTRSRRGPSPESPDSGDSEDYTTHYPRAPAGRWPPVPPAAGYAPSNSSGPALGAFPPGHAPPYQHANGAIPSDQLVRLGHPSAGGPPYGPGAYPYGAQYQAAHGANIHQFYPHEQGHPRHPSRPPPQARIDQHNPSQPHLPPHMAGHVSPPYPGSPFHQELLHYAPNPYYNYRDPYPMVPGIVPPNFFPYPQVPPQNPAPEPAASPAAAPAAAATPTPGVDAAKDEAIARLEKLIMDERTEREAKEAARLAQIEREAAEKAAREQQLVHDQKIAQEAAFLARADAEKKAAEAAAAAKEEAEKAAAAAATEAAAAATAAATAAAAEAANAAAEAAKKPPPEKKKPIKFKDAVGRKFSFPFELCATWQGMEDLIKQAFLHIEVIGPHVAEGHYDLVGPNGDIILPQVWETVVEPDWTITMHMWPIPEKPKEDPAAKKEEAAAGHAKADSGPVVIEPKKKAEAPKKPVRKGDGGGFAKWMMGGRPPPKGPKGPKAEKKPDPAPQ